MQRGAAPAGIGRHAYPRGNGIRVWGRFNNLERELSRLVMVEQSLHDEEAKMRGR